MRDICERLRNLEHVDLVAIRNLDGTEGYERYPRRLDVCDEAAELIERLRSTVEVLEDALRHESAVTAGYRERWEACRSAAIRRLGE